MAPFLMNHPRLIHNWIAAREWALAEVRGLARASDDEVQVWIAGESEEAAFALAEKSHLPDEFLRKFADFNEIQNKHEQ